MDSKSLDELIDEGAVELQERLSKTVDDLIAFQPVFNGTGNKLPDYYRLNSEGTVVEISRSEYKQGMLKGFTVRHKVLPTCGHSLILEHEPRHRNCEFCWFTFFQTHGELTQSCEEVFSKFGDNGLRQLRGPKFTKNFRKFMSTIAHWKKLAEQSNPGTKETNNDEQSICGTGSSDGTAITPCGAD